MIPCFNEETRLPPRLREVEAYLRGRDGGYEIVLVDDGSTDGTWRVLTEIERDHPQVRALLLPSNRGKGRAVAAGVEATRGRLILMSDADFSVPMDELPKLEAAIQDGAGVAIGSRAAPGAREVDQPLHRRVLGKAFNRMIRVLVLPGIRDTQCGFKLFRGDLARTLFAGLRTDGFAFDVEILRGARAAGCRVEEIPVRWINSDSSRVRAFRHSAQMLRDVLRIRLARA